VLDAQGRNAMADKIEGPHTCRCLDGKPCELFKRYPVPQILLPSAPYQLAFFCFVLGTTYGVGWCGGVAAVSNERHCLLLIAACNLQQFCQVDWKR
jgi:hypothetical protein